jgi:hypothetical protein
MLEDEIKQILGNPADYGSGLNKLADDFRRGRDKLELIRLLDSNDAEVVSSAAWILKEIPEHIYNSPKFIGRLHRLIFHDVFDVRFSAFGALFPLLSPADAATMGLLKRMKSDPRDDLVEAATRAEERWHSL